MIDTYELPAGKMRSKMNFNPNTKKFNREVTFMYKACDLHIDDLYKIHENLSSKNANGIDVIYSGQLSSKSTISITSVFE